MPRSPRRWTPEEDRVLLRKWKQQRECLGPDTTISWSSVSKSIANRNAKDCRKRWSKLTSARKGLWTASEDKMLLEGVENFGPQWVRVAKLVGTRNADRK